MANNNKRPVFLDLTRIHQPVMAVMSIAHRIAGVLLFLAIPFAAYLLDLSLRGPESFAEARALLDHGAVKLFLWLLIWAFAHHFFAGLRYLLIDLDVGVDLATGRRTAMAALGAGAAAFLLGGVLLL